MVLSDKVTDDEDIARVICDSMKKKKFIVVDNSGSISVKPSVFLDSRNPIEVSVNRVSTLTILERHNLGIQHQQKNQPDKKYYGFAQIKVSECRKNNCDVIKDDIGGTLPYHANILYPESQSKENDHFIARKIAYHSQFIKYKND